MHNCTIRNYAFRLSKCRLTLTFKLYNYIFRFNEYEKESRRYNLHFFNQVFVNFVLSIQQNDCIFGPRIDV